MTTPLVQLQQALHVLEAGLQTTYQTNKEALKEALTAIRNNEAYAPFLKTDVPENSGQIRMFNALANKCGFPRLQKEQMAAVCSGSDEDLKAKLAMLMQARQANAASSVVASAPSAGGWWGMQAIYNVGNVVYKGTATVWNKAWDAASWLQNVLLSFTPAEQDQLIEELQQTLEERNRASGQEQKT